MRHAKLRRRYNHHAKLHIIPVVIKKHPLSTTLGFVTTLGVASGIAWYMLKNK